MSKLLLASLTVAMIVVITTAFTFVSYEEKTTIVAAANLKVALDSIVKIYKIQNPNADVQVIYGASGKLFEQISNDAPFDLFFSADMDYPTKLKEKSLTHSNIKIYAIGQLAMWSKKIDPNINRMNSLLDPAVNKIAIANPIGAPYGEKAIESMRYYKVYSKVQDKLVYGENIIQTAQFVTSGAADIGIVALSLALSPNMQKEGGKYFVLPKESHKPIEQGCVVLKHGKGNKVAVGLYDFMSSSEAGAILTYYGYNQKKK